MSTHSDEAKATKTLLTALRVFQAERKRNPAGVGFDGNLFNDLLDDNEIDELCEAIGVGFKVKRNTDVKPNESGDDNYEKSEAAFHALKSHYDQANNKTYAKLEFDYNYGDYTDLYFRFDLDGDLDDEHNSDVFVKIICSIRWSDNRLYCTATLDSKEKGDDCELPVSLALQHEVNDVCKKLIDEQRQALADAGINLSSVSDVPEWVSPRLLEKPQIQAVNREYAHLAYQSLNNYYNKKNHECPSLLMHDEGDNIFVDSDFRCDLNGIFPIEYNDVVISVQSSLDCLKKHIDCNAALVSKESGDMQDLPIPIRIQEQALEVCKKLIDEQRQVLADAGISLPSVNDTPAWNYPESLEKPKSVTEKIYDLLIDYHSEDLNSDLTEPAKFEVIGFSKNDDSRHVSVYIDQSVGNTIQNENHTDIKARINYRIDQKDTDDLTFRCMVNLVSREMNHWCDLPIPLPTQKEICETCALLAVEVKYFLSTNGVKLASVDDKPVWDRPDLLEKPPQKQDSGYEEWSQVLADMANEASHEVDEDDGCRPS